MGSRTTREHAPRPVNPDGAAGETGAVRRGAGLSGAIAWAVVTQEVITLLGRKWVVPVMRELSGGTMRHFQLRTAIKGVTPKVLTETLRSLERDGVVERVLHKEAYGAASVAYALTDLGETLWEPLSELHRWAKEHLDEVHRCQRAADDRRAVQEP